MTSHRSAPLATTLAVAATLLLATSADAQSLAQRVARAPAGPVQFTYPARDGACGNGRGFLMVGRSTMIGDWSGDPTRESCVAGPVRVVLARAGEEIVDVDTYVGPPIVATGATDLGRVSGAEAAAYLLSLAARIDGKPGRDAILPAALADSARIAPELLALARDQGRPRETRRGAISWLAREVDERDGGGLGSERVVQALLEIARDERDAQPVRQHALNTLGRLEHGEGIPALIGVGRTEKDSWLAKQAVQALARSGDPRARQYLRDAARRTDMGDEVRATVLRALGGEYATASDLAFLRELYPSLDSERGREAVLVTLSEAGGADNARWLLSVARNDREPARLRRRAVQLAERAGVKGEELVAMYDSAGDRETKEALIGVYAQLGTRASTDKLLAIAKTETDPALRRRVIQMLGRSDDPRVKDALKEMVER